MFAFDVAPDRSGAAVVACGGGILEVVAVDAAVGWLADEALAAVDRHVALARRAASSSVIAEALALGARVAASQGDADGAKTRLKDALQESIRDGDWPSVTNSLDAAVATFCYLGETEPAVVLAGAIDSTLAPLRWPYIASRGPGLQYEPPTWYEPGKRWEKASTNRLGPKEPQ